ncbi:SCO6745 family protein [Planotetraspora sp. GP83]|uniref:SCO6745 family protein n=1 Tax=Planotetraspora sp. GP83 TaxID=3156264 RepID=UPI003513B3D6
MVDPHVARQGWRRLEPVHAMVYFVPEATEQYAALGLTDWRSGYFASRAAAFGPASPELVIATFYNFSPRLIRRALPAAWGVVSPDKLLAARLDAAGAALRRADIHARPDLEETLALARRAALAACERLPGRPLFAAHAALPWPEDPVLALWHAQTLLREYRGDGHIAVLAAEELSGLDALILHAAAAGDMPVSFLKKTRGWSREEWAAGEDALRSRGLLGDGLTVSERGQALRRRIEERTDELALPAYAALGEEGCERLAVLARGFGRAVVDAGLLTLPA